MLSLGLEGSTSFGVYQGSMGCPSCFYEPDISHAMRRSRFRSSGRGISAPTDRRGASPTPFVALEARSAGLLPHYKSEGQQCRKEASPGTNVCNQHGALIPAAQAKAATRIQMSVDDAVKRLHSMRDDANVYARDKIKILHDVLDRGGLEMVARYLLACHLPRGRWQQDATSASGANSPRRQRRGQVVHVATGPQKVPRRPALPGSHQRLTTHLRRSAQRCQQLPR